MTDHPIRGMMDTTLQKIREMVDASTVIGDAIHAGDATIIPVSKISYGFASGGSDLPSKQEGEYFGGGGGAGVSVTPVAFIVICGSDVRMLQIDDNHNTANKLVDSVPDIIDRLSAAFSERKKSSAGDSDNNA
ncbi:MAG: sporulation protein YtfJ [Ruminococcaceae bacterium]|nr:sporulation protein YtfJ [Oscillospiraceae bacterium]